MIIEHALLRVRHGENDDFEQAMRNAVSLIAASPGFRGIDVRRPADGGDHYLLLISWDDIASHRDGFRKSERYKEWSSLLHGYYAPMPQVGYFGPSIIDTANGV